MPHALSPPHERSLQMLTVWSNQIVAWSCIPQFHGLRRSAFAINIFTILLIFSGCEADVVYNTTTIKADLNSCINQLQLDAPDGCGSYWEATRDGCFTLSDQQGDTHSIAIRFAPEGLTPIEGDASLYGDLDFTTEAGARFSLFLYRSAHDVDPSRCVDLNTESSCEGDCVLAMLNQPLNLSQRENALYFASEQCAWTTQNVMPLSETICDGTDNDCDGVVDEVPQDLLPASFDDSESQQLIGSPCSDGIGACETNGTYQCQDGPGYPPTCQLDTPQATPSPELCDQIDNDCNGQVDDGLGLGAECSAFKGVCLSPGEIACATEEDVANQLATTAFEPFCSPLSPEKRFLAVEGEANGVCNHLDDDCDGFVDEHFVSQVELCGAGSCSMNAANACVRGEVVSRCREGEILGPDNDCNQIDDDCDGETDEDFLREQVRCGPGACSSEGSVICTDNGRVTLCDPDWEAVRPDNDCDGIDDDCDGNIDDDYVSENVQCGIGACRTTGVRECTATGLITTCTPLPPQPDTTCDGIDDDCDGRFDEGYLSQVTTCGLGLCARTGLRVCINSQPFDTCQDPAPPNTPDLCDGFDSDCDGRNDEDHIQLDTTCGVGACLRGGFLRCSPQGQVYDSCFNPPPPNDDFDTDCDQRDSDCDGRTDEGYTGVTVACEGIGNCASEGVTTCLANGQLGDTCVEGQPALNDETCDQVDDDCDGNVDEDFLVEQSTCGTGVCVSSGQKICENGVIIDTCVINNPEGDDSSCDQQDSDCDGRIDEAFTITATQCGQGVCATQGLKICDDGQEVDTCSPLPQSNLGDAQCDGIDQDCDGDIDEHYSPPQTFCGQGACERTGLLICLNGDPIDTCPTIDPPQGDDDTICDRSDTDCDGIVDEGYQSLSITCGTGECQKNGQTICQNGNVVEECIEGTPEPTDASCDLKDNDCDGQEDEDFVPVEVTCQAGACQNTGQEICTTTGIVNTCVVSSGDDDSTCNGVNEDCDGDTDEDYVPPPQSETTISCGVGVCFNDQGTLMCSQGSVIPSCTPGEPLGDTDTTCDELDDDCDGRTDEDFTTPVTCGQGECTRNGFEICVNGRPDNTCVAADPLFGYDRCGFDKDDNCDGVVTPYPTLGQACEVTTLECVNVGQWICNGNLDGVTCNAQAPIPSVEVCDDVDNDCDGVIDNVDFDPSSCLILSAIGECKNGSFICLNGQQSCQAGSPAPEDVSCNDLDDDCDSVIDEELVDGETRREGTQCSPGCKWRCGPDDTQLTCRSNANNQECP